MKNCLQEELAAGADRFAKPGLALVLLLVVLGSAAVAGGCAAKEGAPPLIAETNGDIPLADAYLNMKYLANGGLFPAQGPDGTPNDSDPQIVEANRFYDSVGAPGGQTTAPLTFDDWKRTFNFSARTAEESLQQWRDRTGVVVYYNQNELGLGRELGCAEFDDDPAPDGTSARGIACFVTNYGASFTDMNNALRAAAAGDHPKNTVCITYRPSLGADDAVQFYVYGRDGKRQSWAQLDTLGPRPHPYVCTNCHGGFYDTDKHLARAARFLPLDPFVLRFADEGSGAGRSQQEDRMREINALALQTPLTEAQAQLLVAMYGGGDGIHTPGRVADRVAPSGWSDSARHRDLYLTVAKPYCGTCHLAMDTTMDGAVSSPYMALESWEAFSRSGSWAATCSVSMPNAQPTGRELWRQRSEPIVIGDQSYGSAIDALLGELGVPSACGDLAGRADCRLRSDPDAVCGNAWSGTACDPESGRCALALADNAPTDPAAPTGVCRLDGSRSCPWPQECGRLDSPLVSGYDGGCFFSADATMSN